MSLTEVFDRAKKQLEGGDLNNGYKVAGRTFESYLTNKDWEDFKSKMPNAPDRYKGREMQIVTRKGHTYPPKMASYASSSRFMFYKGEEIGGFLYEEPCPTGLGGYPAYLDGYLPDKGVYVEAKCHEFYNYSRPKIGKGHKKLLEGIIPMLDNRLNYFMRNGYLYLSWDRIDSGHFDFKQMLCHLSGIANKVLRGDEKTVHFIYLVYRPTEELLCFVKKESNKKRIRELYAAEEAFAKPEMFKLIYGAILQYFNNEKKYGCSEASIKDMLSAFDFTFCDQESFNAVVKAF